MKIVDSKEMPSIIDLYISYIGEYIVSRMVTLAVGGIFFGGSAIFCHSFEVLIRLLYAVKKVGLATADIFDSFLDLLS